jgi:hypothetical protein
MLTKEELYTIQESLIELENREHSELRNLYYKPGQCEKILQDFINRHEAIKQHYKEIHKKINKMIEVL